MEQRAESLSRREFLLACACALLLAAWPVRKVLFGHSHVYSALDTAAVQLPWSAAIGLGPDDRALNQDLSDQANFFYSFHRWVSRSWRAGDPPFWNPLIYAGAPGVANAQTGAFDPQVLSMVALEALGGLDWFHWGYGCWAWLRYALALLGAYVLARRLGLAPAPAALTGVTFGFSGFLVVWLNHPLGHVPPFLPWMLLGLEALRGPRPWRAATGAAVALALAILGGHAETAFYVGLAGGLWALALLRTDRVAGQRALLALFVGTLIASASLLPLYEYLQLSAARIVRQAEADRARVDALALGFLALVFGLGAWATRFFRADVAPRRLGAWLPALLGLTAAVAAATVFFVREGLGLHAALALVPDRLGKPGDGLGGYRGEWNYIEVASPWIAFVALVLAVAALLSPRRVLPRRRLVIAVGVSAFLLSIQLPGLVELYRFVPMVGLGATVRCAAVGSLFLGLLAGEGLQAATRTARLTACALFIPLLVAAYAEPGTEALEAGVETGPETHELLRFALLPELEIDGVDSRFEGWIAPEVNFDLALVKPVRIDAAGRPLPHAHGDTVYEVKLELARTPSAAARTEAPAAVAAAPPNAVWFRTPFLLTSLLPNGLYRFELELSVDGLPVVTRQARVSRVSRSITRSPGTLAFLALGLLFVGVVPARRKLAWGAVVLAGWQGLAFEDGVNPSVPRAWVFPPTETEAVLAAELGPHRYFSDAGVLQANMGLVRGLRHLDGYDAMDPALFNEYRFNVLPGANPLLAWNPRGVDLANPAFRLYGVALLVMRSPFEHAGWELIASPDGPRRAETWIYRATDPLPRAFCVPEVVTLDELGDLFRSGPANWDPLRVASSAGTWRPEQAFTQADVSVPEWTNNTVHLTASLDGDGLLVLTDQYFPGWTVTVDGEERPLELADQIFRGVALSAGTHDVVFRYEPLSLRLGFWLSLAGLSGLGACTVLALRERKRTSAST